MKKIVVNDTNVFIDLLDIGLLAEFFCLPWEIHTTDLVMLELLREGQKETVEVYEKEGRLHIARFEYDEFMEINKLHKRFEAKTNVSLTDCSVWHYAKKNGFALLTGDRKLRSSALNEGVEVHGIIYVFDALVESDVISASMAYEKLTSLKDRNLRLPQNEIDKRIKLWSDEQKEEGGYM